MCIPDKIPNSWKCENPMLIWYLFNKCGWLGILGFYRTESNWLPLLFSESNWLILGVNLGTSNWLTLNWTYSFFFSVAKSPDHCTPTKASGQRYVLQIKAMEGQQKYLAKCWWSLKTSTTKVCVLFSNKSHSKCIAATVKQWWRPMKANSRHSHSLQITKATGH